VLMEKLYSTIIKPIVSEKTAGMAASNRYAFEVSLKSTKPEIRQAIETLFKVNVLSVKTSVVRGKVKRYGQASAKRPNKKKAYVELAANQTIEIFQGA